MPESMLSGFRAALDELRRIGWTIRTGPLPDPNSAAEVPVLVLPPEAEAAFDARGNLIAPFELGWHGLAADAQVAFAVQNLTLVLPLGDEAGIATVLPYGTPGRDLQLMMAALAELRRRGYFAEASLAFTATNGWQAALERSDGTQVVFWTTQDHEDAIDEDSDLISDLPLQWAGDRAEIAEVLAATDLVVRIPESDNEVFYLAPHIVEE